jgi:hypothetical protein
VGILGQDGVACRWPGSTGGGYDFHTAGVAATADTDAANTNANTGSSATASGATAYNNGYTCILAGAGGGWCNELT